MDVLAGNNDSVRLRLREKCPVSTSSSGPVATTDTSPVLCWTSTTLRTRNKLTDGTSIENYICYLRSFGEFKLLRAVVPILCTVSLLCQMALLPSITDTSSSATFCGNIILPLPRLFFFDAASRIHLNAVRLRCLKPSGTGI